MSGKLDQALDSIVATTRRNTKNLRRRPRKSAPGAASKPATTAPVGGVKKSVRPQKKAEKPIPTGPAPKGEGKIIISNLVCSVASA
jgi:THO complex subunit 4